MSNLQVYLTNKHGMIIKINELNWVALEFCSICSFNSNQFSIWSIQDWTVVNIVPFQRVHQLMGGNGQPWSIEFYHTVIHLVGLYCKRHYQRIALGIVLH